MRFGDLAGGTAVVTGAGSGIGESAARRVLASAAEPGRRGRERAPPCSGRARLVTCVDRGEYQPSMIVKPL